MLLLKLSAEVGFNRSSGIFMEIISTTSNNSGLLGNFYFDINIISLLFQNLIELINHTTKLDKTGKIYQNNSELKLLEPKIE